MKNIFLLLSIFLWGCLSPKNEVISKDFKLSVCEATYKGRALPLNKPIADWVAMFGKYDRTINNYKFIWDSLGIMLCKFHENSTNPKDYEGAPDDFYIFFVNTTSPSEKLPKNEDGIIKLRFNGHFGMHDTIYKKSNINNYEIYLPKTSEPNFFFDPILYPYPIKTYNDTILANGGIIAEGMKLKDVNKYRTQVKGNGKFVYWNMGGGSLGKNTGDPRAKTGPFIDVNIDESESECGKKDNFFYHNLLWYSEGVLEYIKVNKMTKGKTSYYY
jgi:hypothetical protein